MSVSDPYEWYVIDNETGAVILGPVGHRKAKKFSDDLNLGPTERNTFACCKSVALRDGYLNNFIF
jgi:hypothetical protein